MNARFGAVVMLALSSCLSVDDEIDVSPAKVEWTLVRQSNDDSGGRSYDLQSVDESFSYGARVRTPLRVSCTQSMHKSCCYRATEYYHRTPRVLFLSRYATLEHQVTDPRASGDSPRYTIRDVPADVRINREAGETVAADLPPGGVPLEWTVLSLRDAGVSPHTGTVTLSEVGEAFVDLPGEVVRSIRTELRGVQTVAIRFRLAESGDQVVKKVPFSTFLEATDG